jgi:glucan phosphoethanolaminetransferase (alkaline phosphatase superfamily)
MCLRVNRKRTVALMVAVAPAPALVLALRDLSLRTAKLTALSARHTGAYLGSVLLSAALWGGLLMWATSRKRFGLALGLLGLASVVLIGNQMYAFQRFRAYLDGRAALLGTTMLPSVKQQLATDLAGILRATLPAGIVVLGAALVLRRLHATTSTSAAKMTDAASLALLLALFLAPDRFAVQGAMPDVLALSALGQLARAHWAGNDTVKRLHPGARSPDPVARLPKPTGGRSVLFILNESVRAASTCTAYDPSCTFTPFSNEAAKTRFPLLQMRTLDSTTAISLSVMWSGLLPTASREQAHSAPLVWEIAAAAGLSTGYWTSQNMMFGNSGLWLSATHFTKGVHAAELEEAPSLEVGADDMKLVTRALSDLQTLPQPFLGVVHLSNTHFPYRIDEQDAPYLPQSADASLAHRQEILNRYLDAIHHQDRAIARLIEGVRATAPDTVVVYTSDHGEQMFEKGSHSHTSTLYEPEVHVPAWIDARPGLLSNAEVIALQGIREAPRTTIDIFPTLLDAIGLWEATRGSQQSLRGNSLLRGGSQSLLPMSNCSGLWACAFRNWGAISGSRKLFATQGDTHWMCFDVVQDPHEEVPLSLDSCSDLRAEAERQGTPF